MDIESKAMTPKPFVFVLMPFASEFNDIYKYGIKGAAEDVGAYAERIDTMLFKEGILDSVFNQINKADVIVADMTGQNANVFYEVGYAHALGKMVLLLTKDDNDIPFDLKNYQHTVYGGSIETLRTELSKKLAWAIKEAERQGLPKSNERYEVRINDVDVPESKSHDKAPHVLRISTFDEFIPLQVVVRNGSFEMSSNVSHIYLFTQSQTVASVYEQGRGSLGHVPIEHIAAHPSDAEGGFARQYRLNSQIPALPPSASDTFKFSVSAPKKMLEAEKVENFKLRLHSNYGIHDFPFKLFFQKT